MRARSKFAVTLANERKERGGFASTIGEKAKVSYIENA